MMVVLPIFVLILVTLSCHYHPVLSVLVNDRPIIGVYAQPASIMQGGEYIAASYVKWIESAGGRVVPIGYDAPFSELDDVFSSINGLLFPGGDALVNDKASYLYALALKANDAGNVFPVWGTCLGFEWLLQMTSKDTSILDHGYDAMNISLSLDFTSAPSRIFQNASPLILETFVSRNVTLNNHHSGIEPENFYAHPVLSAFYSVVAVNIDRQARPFVSIIEAKNYPIYGVQFHPEKNMFEWGTYENGMPYEVIDHEKDAVSASQYLADFFISQARRNTQHRFDCPVQERHALIYNFQTFTFTWPAFVESYFFPPKVLSAIS